MSFARRLVAGSVLILALAILILLWVAERSLRRDLQGDLARTLEREARLVSEALPPDSTEWPAAVRRLAVQTGPETKIRRNQVEVGMGELMAGDRLVVDYRDEGGKLVARTVTVEPGA